MAGGSHDDPVWTLILMLVVILFIGWLTWYFLRPEFLEFLRYVRLLELAPIGFFDSHTKACVTFLQNAQVELVPPSMVTYNAAVSCFGAIDLARLPAREAMEYFAITPTSIGATGRLAAHFYKPGLIAFCAATIYYALFVSYKNKFRTRYDLEAFIKIQEKIWPVISPIVKLNPTKHSARIPGSMIPDKVPLFAEAFSPEEWISFHRIPVVNGVPDRERVRRAFLSQLGPRWQGYEGLPPYMLGLMAAFALKGAQKREESDTFLGKLAVCWTPERGFKATPELMAEIRKILKDPEIGGLALKAAEKFAYRTTAIVGTLKWARFMGGVLAAAQFLWLRGVDRDLWYALNNLGRRTFHSEGAGAMAHYMAEDAAGKALPIPRLETAIITLNQYLAANQPVIPPREEPGQAKA